jgi:hypothetical protein
MTQDEIIDMAMLAGFESDDAYIQRQDLKAFAKLVAEKEREACAKVCEQLSEKMTDMAAWGAQECLKAIKARGNT